MRCYHAVNVGATFVMMGLCGFALAMTAFCIGLTPTIAWNIDRDDHAQTK